MGLAGLILAVALVAISVFSADSKPRTAPILDPDIPEAFRGPNIHWNPRMEGGKTHTLSVHRGIREDLGGCSIVFESTSVSRPNAPPPDVQVSHVLASNPDTCENLLETVNFDPSDPDIQGMGAPPLSGGLLSSASNSGIPTPARAKPLP